MRPTGFSLILLVVASAAGSALAQGAAPPVAPSVPPIAPTAPSEAPSPWSTAVRATEPRRFLLGLDLGVAATSFSVGGTDYSFVTKAAGLTLGWNVRHPETRDSLSLALAYVLAIRLDASGVVHRHQFSLDVENAGWFLARFGLGPVFYQSDSVLAGIAFTSGCGFELFHSGFNVFFPIGLDVVSDILMTDAGISLGFRTL